MQTLWDFKSFTVGHTRDSFKVYFEKIAQWESLGDLQVCDPAKQYRGTNSGVLGQLKEFFSDDIGKVHGTKGCVTRVLSEAAGFQLRWSMKLRCLKIEPGQWNEPAPLPETDPNDFFFWYCPTLWGMWGKNVGGDLLVTPAGEEGQEFKYRVGGGGGRAVLVHNMPHLLLGINEKATEPYYCLYGQLQETK